MPVAFVPVVPVFVTPVLVGVAREVKTGPGLLVRAIWFILVGWWLTGFVSALAWGAMVTITG